MCKNVKRMSNVKKMSNVKRANIWTISGLFQFDQNALVSKMQLSGNVFTLVMNLSILSVAQSNANLCQASCQSSLFYQKYKDAGKINYSIPNQGNGDVIIPITSIAFKTGSKLPSTVSIWHLSIFHI